MNLRGAISALILMAPGAALSDTFRDWQVACAGQQKACILSTSAIAHDDTWLATLRLQLVSDQSEPGRLQALVPPSVHLGSGLFFGLGRDDPLQLSYLRCAPDHCEAAAAIDEARLAAMMAGRSAVLTYRPSITSPPVSFEISLMGITAAIGHARAFSP